MTGRACSAEVVTGAMTGVTGKTTAATSAMTGKTTAATSAMTGKTVVVGGPGCSGNRELDDQAGQKRLIDELVSHNSFVLIAVGGARSRAGARRRSEWEVGRMAVRKIANPSIDERKAKGLEARDRSPPPSHTKWRPTADRPDPVALLEEQNVTREPDLVPVRHGRMMVSPFTFYRGAAKIMAADLADTPVAGLEAQLCGDAHLSNFGLFASPERRLLFDLNDFDETLPGPFEYDVKRMAASFEIAGRNNGFSKADTRAATLASVRAYREAMATFAQMGTMDIWYAHLDEDELMAAVHSTVAETRKQAKGGKAAKKEPKAARRRTSWPR